MSNLKVFVCSVTLFSLLGCGGGDGKTKPETVNVSGTIYLKKAPLADADVRFVSPDGLFASFGKTDANGKYTLVQGAVPGKNRVIISKLEGKELNLDPDAGFDAGQLEAAQANDPTAAKKPIGPVELVPADYSDPEKSKLTYDVLEGGTESADFQLQ